MIESRKCHARTRKGHKCQSPAMKNGRCRMHGGMSTGAPKGNQNAYKHGDYSADTLKFNQKMKEMLKETKKIVEGIL